MNYIFVNKINFEEKFKTLNRAIDETITIKEIYIGEENIKEILELRSSKSKFFKYNINKIKVYIYERKLKKEIKNVILEGDNYFVFSDSIKNDKTINKYMKDTFINLGITEYVYNGEFKNNIQKHIERYCTQNKKEANNIKCLVVVKDSSNIDIAILEDLLASYKTINIYSLIEAKKIDIDRINKLNLREGTTISIMSNTKKSYKEYDVAIYLDGLKSEFRKLRFNNLSLQIELENKEMDDFDINNIKVKELLRENKIIETVANRLFKNYGRNTVSSVIIKII